MACRNFHQSQRAARALSRREFLFRSGGGLGGVALAQLLMQHGAFADTASPGRARPGMQGILGGQLHHPPKATRVIQLFMNGGASPADTYDYKPELIRLHGTKFNPGAGVKVEAATSAPGALMKSPWTWKQYGQSGKWATDVFPHVNQHIDDLAFLMAMQSPTSEHSGGVYRQTSGFVVPGYPCMGAWISYGLGSLSDNLPAFVVLPDSRGLPYNAKNTFGSGFLPVADAGVMIRPSLPNPLADLFPPQEAKFITPQSESEGLALLEKLNHEHLEQNPGDSRLDARIASYELAARMQLSAPQVLDLSGEDEKTKSLYGLDNPKTLDFGRNCLLARRMLERGVRFVQLFSGMDGAAGNWDNHGNVKDDLAFIAGLVDKPIAGLLTDLKRRGMLDDTLVIWTTEFGRMPFSQGSLGRDHNGGTFVTWLAGAGVKPGTTYGESDEVGWKASKNVTDVHDMHATILHLLGVDHKRLTFRTNGIDRRLTDVHGEIITPILA